MVVCVRVVEQSLIFVFFGKQAWWGNDTYEAFKERQQCFVDQYDQFHYKIFDQIPEYKGSTSVNGTQTLGENIAGTFLHYSFPNIFQRITLMFHT